MKTGFAPEFPIKTMLRDLDKIAEGFEVHPIEVVADMLATMIETTLDTPEGDVELVAFFRSGERPRQVRRLSR